MKLTMFKFLSRNSFPSLSVFILLTGLLVIVGCTEQSTVNQQDVTRHIKQSEAYLNQGQFRAANIEARNAIQKNPANIDGHITLAHLLNELGRYKKSVQQLEQLPESAYHNSEFLFTLLRAYIGRGKFLSAENILQEHKALLNQQLTRFQLAKAKLQVSQGQLTSAEDIYHQLLNQEPDNFDGLLGLIQLKYQQGEKDSLQKLIVRADKISPFNPDIDFIQAKVRIDQQQYEQAESLLTEAVSNLPNADVMTPRKSALLQLLSETLTIQGKTTEALIYTQKIAEAFPGAEIAQGEFRDASLSFEKGQFEKAESILAKLVTEYPGFEDASVLLAIIKYRNGDIVGASDYFNRGVDAEITHPNITKLAAVASMRSNQPERVLTLLNRYRHSHDDPQILVLLAQAALALNEYDKAENALRRAIALDPTITQSYLVLADLYNSQTPADTVSALEALKAGHQQDLNDFEITAGIARQLFFSRQIQEAKQFIEQTLASESTNAAAYQLAGDFYYSQQQWTRASDYYQQALLLDANDFESAVKLAMIARDTLSYTQQLEAWQAAALINKNSVLAVESMLSHARTVKEVNQAERKIITLSKVHNSSIAYSVLARFYAERGQLDKAREYQEKLIQSAPDSLFYKEVELAIYYEDAKQNIRKGDIGAARKSTIAAIRLEPSSPRLLILLTEIEIQIGNYGEAQKLINQIDLNNAMLANELQGDLYSAKNNFDAAIENYQLAWDHQASNGLGTKIYRLLGTRNNDKQKYFLLEWINKMPNSIDVLTTQANNYLIEEDYPNAIVLLEKIDKIQPSSVINLNNLAWAYQKMGNSAALKTAKRAYELAPNHASVMDTYGWILFEAGELEEAENILTQALTIEPENEEISNHLEDVKNAVTTL